MTPAARVQTAIECLDAIAGGDAAERVLTRWARGARHAGSGDRAAVRDLVFDVLRRWWSSAARGGGETGRARMAGYLAETEAEPDALFDGSRYGPAPLGEDERPGGAPEGAVALDCPPEFEGDLHASLGEDFADVMAALRARAPVFLRVNLVRGDVDAAREALAAEGIETRAGPLSPTALEVLSRPRAVAGSGAFREGLVELQDAASQAVVDMLPLGGAARVLDYCAGGGGKTLAMAARQRATYHAHDASVARLAPLEARAARAGVAVALRDGVALAREAAYDLVLVDAPCSGSGAWRRAPEGKIRLTRARLAELQEVQADVLARAAAHVRPGGTLAYATCSLLDAENGEQVTRFLEARGDFVCGDRRRWTPRDGADGFFCALLTRRDTTQG